MLPPIVDIRFQILFHSPPGVLFTFPSRYSFTIGHQGVFSLTQWSGLIPTEFHVLYGTWETVAYSLLICHLRGYHALWHTIPGVFYYINRLSQESHLLNHWSHFPHTTTNGFLHSMRFWLFPFRSPLLGESLRFLFLALLRCFSSGGYLPYPIYSDKDAWSLSKRVAPFGNPRIIAWLAAPRGFKQPPTSFIVSWYHGIHRMPFSIIYKLLIAILMISTQ